MRENSIFFLVNIFCQELKGQKKNCEGSDILPNFHINVTCPSFTDVGRRCETPRSEIKDFITNNSARSISFKLLLDP